MKNNNNIEISAIMKIPKGNYKRSLKRATKLKIYLDIKKNKVFIELIRMSCLQWTCNA